MQRQWWCRVVLLQVQWRCRCSDSVGAVSYKGSEEVGKDTQQSNTCGEEGGRGNFCWRYCFAYKLAEQKEEHSLILLVNSAVFFPVFDSLYGTQHLSIGLLGDHDKSKLLHLLITIMLKTENKCATRNKHVLFYRFWLSLIAKSSTTTSKNNVLKV